MQSINKDYIQLKEVSESFTEEKLKNILCTVHNGKEINILSWKFSEANAKGDSYLSTVYKIKITGTVDGKEVELDLVVKSLPENIGRRNTYRSTEFFYNEDAFYTKVIPEFEKLLKEKSQIQVLCIPRYLDSIIDGKNDYIALQDVSAFGYKPIARQSCLNEDLCFMILKTLAKFHAISFALRDQKKEKFVEIVEHLRETYFSTKHWQWYKRFFEKLVDIAKNALAMEYPGSEAEKKFNSYKPDDLYQKAAKLCDRKYESTSVVSHGDTWIPNYLARQTTENEALMLDFQLTRCCSPILDISTYIYACTEKAIWDEKFDTLLEFYYKELSNTISLLGSDPKKLYPWDTFMTEVKEQFVFGMIFGLEIIPMSLLDESDTFDLDVISGDNAVNIADVWTLSNIKTKSGRLRLTNMIVHAVQKGFLQ